MIVRPGALNSIRYAIEADLRRRVAAHEPLTENCRWIASSLALYPGSQAALQASAPIYARLRGSQVLFARHDGSNLIVESRNGFGPSDRTYFKGPNMSALLLQLLAERFSLLIASFDAGKYPDKRPVALYYDNGEIVEEKTLSGWALERLSPVALERAGQGQALITPLELTNTASLSYGLIYEYRPTFFFLNEIAEARVYASAFMAEIARRIASNH